MPNGKPWQYWLFLAGRGAGKTRSGAEWVREQVQRGYKHIGLIAPTAADIRDVMIEGSSGILSVCWEKDVDAHGQPMGRPVYEPSKRHRLTWANGAVCHGYSAEEPDRLRGPQHEKLWCDELAAWQYAQETWDMAMFGLRLGKSPQAMVSTTPRPIPIVRELTKSPLTVITRSSTYANRPNLAGAFLDAVVRKYEGTRLGRQELMGEILEEVEGALWQRSTFDACTLTDKQPPDLTRIVVSIDPAITSNATSNLTGIVAAGIGRDKCGYVLSDKSGRYSPNEWGNVAVKLYDELKADRIVAEGNQGGDMVRHVIETVRPNVPITIVHASRSKQARAEPVAGLYEQSRVFHVRAFPEMEDQMCVATGTLITTDRGLVAVEDVRRTDLVMTRAGFAPMKWVGRTGVKPTLTIKTELGFHVKLSYNHPVYVLGRGFVPAEDLKTGDRVICHGSQSTTVLSSKTKSITGKQAATTAQVVHAVASSFMSLCGKVHTDACRAAKKFITSISTQATTSLETWNASRTKSTPHGMNLAVLGSLHQSSAARCVAMNGPSGSLVRFPASNAEQSLRQLDSVQSFADVPVVASSTISEIKKTEVAEVWDLTVDGLPEFFGNGILLHNCTWEPLSGDPSPDRLDALVWALTNLMLDAQVIPFVSPIVTGSPRNIPGQ